MRVHIVTTDTQSDQILARLTRALLEQTHWTAGTTPRSDVDLNYFFPYLEWWAHRDFTATKTAAWFTHYDTAQKYKLPRWDACEQQIDLRLTSASMYLEGLQRHGAAALVTPPLDHARFYPSKSKRAHRLPVVGTSGFVYKGGRKGEHLIQRLAHHELAQRITLRASGAGWGIPTTKHTPEKLTSFYQGLDVYLCTSLIEGVGYGVLEALACGIPCVIPYHVGIYDDLPAVQNIHRYTAGDFDEMIAALEAALAEPVNVASLTGIASRFTAAQWTGDHVGAFERLLYDVPAVGALPAWKGHSGVVYVAYGQPARECAERAMRSFNRQHPDVPVCLIADRPIGLEHVFVQHPDNDIGARGAKTQLYDLVPAEWEYVLYLDADTEVVADISLFYELLSDGWEAVFCINPPAYVLARDMKRPDNADECAETFALMGSDELLQLNGGVFAFRRNERTARFFRAWNAEWTRYGKRDQAALDRVLYTQPLRLYVLGNEWNTITRYLPAERTAGVLHYPLTARRWRGMIRGRLDGGEAWAAVHPEPDADYEQEDGEQ